MLKGTKNISVKPESNFYKIIVYTWYYNFSSANFGLVVLFFIHFSQWIVMAWIKKYILKSRIEKRSVRTFESTSEAK